MSKVNQGARLAHFILLASALLLPSLSLIPFGGLYLWQNGLLLWWALAALVVVGVTTLLQRRVFGVVRQTYEATAAGDAISTDPTWGPSEEMAWGDVEKLAASANVEDFTDPQAFLDLGRRTINVVARRMHPEKQDALWQFTLPEALAISERVSRRLAGYVNSHVPFGDRMTLAQFWSIYRWRRGVEFAEKAYDVWRLLRIINPATAITHEARERLSRAALQWGRDHVGRRFAGAFVEEVGRAAIDLYGGRLRVAAPSADEKATATRYLETPLVVLVAGGDTAAREMITNDLEGERLLRERTDFMAVSSAADLGTKRAAGRLADEIGHADVVVWLMDQVSVTLAGEALKAVEAYFAARPQLRRPPVLPAILGPSSGLDLAILEKVADPPVVEPVLEISATRLDRDSQTVELWRRLAELTPRARRSHVARMLDDNRRERSWAGASRQAFSAATAIAGSLLKKRPARGPQK